MRIVTSGGSYADIDVYGGITAYAELLRLQGVEARAVTTGALNDSIPPIVRQWDVSLDRSYTPHPDDTFTIIDLSVPDYFETFVDPDRIDAIIDHHPGMETYWQERIGDRAVIEHVGAACTQVYEKWAEAGLAGRMSRTSARLLMCGILDNTLNFGADVTTPRDHAAYAALAGIADLPEDWPAVYFRDCQDVIMRHVAESLAGDLKTPKFPTYPRAIAAGQLALWDGADFAARFHDEISRTLSAGQPDWLMNVISISEKRSYLVSDVPEVKTWLEGLLGVTFDGDIAAADRMWLRKEMMKADIDRRPA